MSFLVIWYGLYNPAQIYLHRNFKSGNLYIFKQWSRLWNNFLTTNKTNPFLTQLFLSESHRTAKSDAKIRHVNKPLEYFGKKFYRWCLWSEKFWLELAVYVLFWWNLDMENERSQHLGKEIFGPSTLKLFTVKILVEGRFDEYLILPNAFDQKK